MIQAKRTIPEAKKIFRPFLPVLILSLFVVSGISHAAVLSTDAIEQPPSSAASVSSEETAAKIVSLEGDVKILKKGTEAWRAAGKNQLVEVGDQILTGKNSSADIAYDDYLLNISHLKENTKAEIRSLHPTDIYLEDGSIFSALDGLSGQSGYQIATPTAVAAVRGTHFDVGYDKASQKFTAASLPTGDENHVSKIVVSDPKNPDSEGVEVMENKQLDLKFGEPIQQNLIRPADPARLEAGKAVFAQMGQHLPRFQELRDQGKTYLQKMKQKTDQTDKTLSPYKKNGAQEPKKEEKERFKNSGQSNEIAPTGSETPAADPLENVRALDAMLEENKPQETKPFGSYKPQRQSGFGNISETAQTAGENQNQGQENGPVKMKPFGEMKPQSINSMSGSKPGLGTQGGVPKDNRQKFQPQQPAGGSQNNSQPSERRQGPPPQGPPKR